MREIPFLCTMKAFRFIWALWGFVVFIHSLIIVTILYAVIFISKGKKADITAHRLSRAWGWYLLFLFGIRLKVYGKENLNPETAYIFISNHQSQLDIPVASRTTANTFKFLAKEELTKIPLLGYIIKRLYITVGRDNWRDRALSMKKMQESLDKGVSVWIYPEGTRNKTDKPLGELFPGAFQLAAHTGRPIAVCTITGTGKLLPPGELFLMRPGLVKCYWEIPFTILGKSTADVNSAMEKVKGMMEGRLREGY